jgi:phage shock protein PspC (stress-responsive transcriptional regulator)
MDTTTTDQTTPSSDSTTSVRGPSTLRRPIHDRMLAGVAVGLADYLDVDVTLVRIGLVVLAVIGGAGIPLYLAGWLLIPEEGASRSIAADLLGRTPRPSNP